MPTPGHPALHQRHKNNVFTRWQTEFPNLRSAPISPLGQMIASGICHSDGDLTKTASCESYIWQPFLWLVTNALPTQPHSSADPDQCLVSTAVTGKRVGSNGAGFSPIRRGSFCSFPSISQVSEDQGVEREGLPSSRGRTLKGYTQLAHVLGWGFIALQWFQMRKEAIVLSHQNSPLAYRR